MNACGQCRHAHQGLAAAKVAIERMKAAGVAWKRPVDYYAEMVKSDGHMRKVKDQLMFQQRQIDQAEERCVLTTCMWACGIPMHITFTGASSERPSAFKSRYRQSDSRQRLPKRKRQSGTSPRSASSGNNR